MKIDFKIMFIVFFLRKYLQLQYIKFPEKKNNLSKKSQFFQKSFQVMQN